MTFNQASGRQIKTGSLDNTHFKANAGIDESKIVIDWASRGAAILASKLLVDYVQVNGKAIPSASSNVTVTDISATAATLDTEKGAIVQAGKNTVILRDAVTGDPVISVDGTEVYGKLTHTGSRYDIEFFYKDSAKVEKPYTFAEAATIDYQFPQRFDLNTIAESFASNEKFVDGASDVSSRLDLEQLSKDAFGSSYILTQDGIAKRTKSIVAELTERTVGVTNTDFSASEAIDELISARGASEDLATRLGAMQTAIESVATATTEGDKAIKSALASVEAGKGASLIGVADSDSKFEGTTLEAVLAEVGERLHSVEQTGGFEVESARESQITGPFESLNDRLNAGETRFEAVRTEVESARGTFADLSGKIDDMDTNHEILNNAVIAQNESNEARLEAVEQKNIKQDSRITVVEASTHTHFAEDKQVLAGDTLINSSRYDLQSDTFVVGDKSLNVYINGMLQMASVHYQEIPNPDGEGIAITFSPELIVEGMIIQLRWTK